MDQAQLIWISGGLIVSGVFLLLAILLIRARTRARQANQAIATLRDLLRRTDELADDVERRIDARIADIRQVISQADAMKPSSTPHPAATAAPQADSSPVEQTSPTSGVHGEILRLMQQGLDSVEIARRVQMNVGEVELVENLHGRRKGKGAPNS